MPLLEYTGGPTPWNDIDKFVRTVKRKRPGISDLGVSQMVKRAMAFHDPRTTNRVRALLGRDIMSATPEDLPIWPWLPSSVQERVLEHPYDTGEVVDDQNVKLSRMELFVRLDRRSVNRSVLVSPKGLEQTYVWSDALGWVQDVTKNDYDLILSFENGVSRLFQDPDTVGPYVDRQAYADTQAVKERHVAKDMRDVQALHREFFPAKQFAGASVEN